MEAARKKCGPVIGWKVDLLYDLLYDLLDVTYATCDLVYLCIYICICVYIYIHINYA